ncbi:hypothetical protein IFM89_038162 [Coptis chinensis]|uniref:Uncharacterized protein n=1 Tax=Coptis chinensis TaxID=261450 RepID=A0A835M1W7_9MAGN|nr:hypothetical protein IFM89_038162 [Coptis chinensis]
MHAAAACVRACYYLFCWFTFSLVLKQDLELDDFIYGPRELLIKFVEENYPLLPKPDSLLAFVTPHGIFNYTLNLNLPFLLYALVTGEVDDLKLDSLVVGSRGLGMLKRKNEHHRRRSERQLGPVCVLERDRQRIVEGPHALAS